MSSQDTVKVLPWYQWMFMAVLVLGVAMAVALIVRTVLLATGYESETDPMVTTLSIMVLLCYIGLHLLGYYCQYFKAPLTRWHQWMLIIGSLSVLTAWFSVLTVAEVYQVSIEYRAYIVLASAVMQCISYIGFLVCAINTQCFGCININRIAFYVMTTISAIGFLVYIFIFQWYYDSAIQPSWTDGDGHRNRIPKFKATVPNNLVCSIMLCVGAYQVNMCCIPWSRWDVLLLVLLGGALGVLLIVIISGTNGQIGIYGYYNGNTDFYCLVVLHLVLLVATLLVCHYRKPFPGKYQLWHWSLSLWDTMLVLLVLESLAILVVAIVLKDNNESYYTFLALHAIICATTIGIIHFKEPLSQYWSKDRLACGVLSLVSMLAWLGVMSCYGNSGKTETPQFYCLVVYGIITFVGALYYGFRGGLVQGSCFTKKSTSSSTQLQGSEEAVSSTEVTVESTAGTVEVTRDTE